jgi:tetratricopeptide (TPR) repeat protein/predicted Ser/Thr protein kinase
VSKDEPPSATLSATEAASATASAIGLERRDALGRYIVLDRLGAGGMGVVYLAYDPDLDRKLAVKVLRPEASIDQARLVREARALARVQHPNVIAVHDVGTIEDQVFVAMELVEGTTLSRWVEETKPDWRRIVDAFVQAGRGLAAAHAVGLVHRDFKPSNALVGSDGRVRVVDFGLARSTADVEPLAPPSTTAAVSPSPAVLENITRTGALAGTPSYMSPEQFFGGPVDARSDQFSFSVALYRALFGDRPFIGDNLAALAAAVAAGRVRPPPKLSRVPAWVQKIVLRGLATRADERWPSMDAMLSALQHDPARVRRRWLLAGGAALGMAALALTHPFARREDLVCRGAARKLAGVWDDSRKQSVHAAFAATGQPYAEAAFASVARVLDGWTSGFTAAHTEACEATRVRHELSDEVLDLRMECLGQRLQETKAQVDLFSRADAKIVERSVKMVSSLSSLSGCSDLAALRAPVRPPADAATRATVERARQEIARANALTRAAKFDDAVAVLQPALATARSTGYRPLEAQALVALGYAQLSWGKQVEGEAVLLQAAAAARAGRDALVEVKAWEELVRAADLQGHYDEGERRGRYALAAFEATGSSDQRPRGTLLMTIGTNAADQGKYEEALADDRAALAIHESTLGAQSFNVAASHEAIGRVLGNLSRYEEAEREIRLALTIWEREVGRDSPNYASSLFNLGYALVGQGRYDEALTQYRRTVDIWERTLGRENPRLALPLTNIGDILRLQGRYDEALVYDRRALAIAEKTKGADHPDVGVALNNIADVLRLQHKHDEALASYRRALAIWQNKLAADHPFFATTLTGIGETELDRRQPVPALTSLERALPIAEKHPDDLIALAETRFALARAMWDAARDRSRALTLANAARNAYAGARGQKEQLAAVDAWLTTHR